jgi:hypothetical protein
VRSSGGRERRGRREVVSTGVVVAFASVDVPNNR